MSRAPAINSSVSFAAKSSGSDTTTSAASFGWERSASSHSASFRTGPAGTVARSVRGSATRESAWPVAGASRTMRSTFGSRAVDFFRLKISRIFPRRRRSGSPGVARVKKRKAGTARSLSPSSLTGDTASTKSARSASKSAVRSVEARGQLRLAVAGVPLFEECRGVAPAVRRDEERPSVRRPPRASRGWPRPSSSRRRPCRRRRGGAGRTGFREGEAAAKPTREGA